MNNAAHIFSHLPVIKRYLPCQSISLLCVQLSIIQAFCRRLAWPFSPHFEFQQVHGCQMAGGIWHDQNRAIPGKNGPSALRCLGFLNRPWLINSSTWIKKKWRSGAEVKIEQRKRKGKKKKQKNENQHPKNLKCCDVHQEKKKVCRCSSASLSARLFPKLRLRLIK